MYCLVKLCRLCLAFKGDLNNMCNDNIIEKATACIGDLEFDYNLPSLICNDCLEMLDLFFNFRSRCLQSEFYLNCYMEKLSESRSTDKFKSTDLKVNIMNNINISPIKNFKKHTMVNLQDVIKPQLDEMRNSTSRSPDGTDKIILEDAENNSTNKKPVENKSKLSLKRKLDLVDQSGKKPKIELNNKATDSNSYLDSKPRSGAYTDLMERVKLRKRQVQLNRITTPIEESKSFHKPPHIVKTCNKKTTLKEKSKPAMTNIKEFEPLKTSTKSCIYTCNAPTPKPVSEISTSTDLEKDIVLHHIHLSPPDSQSNVISKTSKEKVSPCPVLNKPMIQVRKLETLKPPESTTEKNDLYKANFSNILQLNTLNSNITQKSVSKDVRSFKILFKNIGHTTPKVKIQYVPILQPVKANVVLSHLNDKDHSSSKLRSLLQQKPSSNDCSSKVTAPSKSDDKCLQSIRNEHNYSTEGYILKNTDSNVGKEVSNYLITSNTNNSEPSVTLKEKINTTWAKYIVLQKINNLSLKSSDTKQQAQQKSVLKSNQTAKNLNLQNPVLDAVIPKEEFILPDFPDNLKINSENNLGTTTMNEKNSETY